MIIISDSLVLAPPTDDQFDPDNPTIGWMNSVNVGNLSSGDPATGASVEDPLHPTANLANPSTYLYFAQLTAGEDVYFQVDNDDDTVQWDYVGLAGHTLGTGQRIVQVFGATAVDISGNPIYSAITQQILLPNNQPAMIKFQRNAYVSIRVVMTATGSDLLRCAVLYVGRLLICQRRVQVTFTPLNYGRMPQVTTQISNSGQFLGQLLIGSTQASACNLMYLEPDWYRANFDPFLINAQTEPFFFAWAPQTYPYEVGYAWFDMTQGMPQPSIHDPTELWQIILTMQGITE